MATKNRHPVFTEILYKRLVQGRDRPVHAIPDSLANVSVLFLSCHSVGATVRVVYSVASIPAPKCCAYSGIYRIIWSLSHSAIWQHADKAEYSILVLDNRYDFSVILWSQRIPLAGIDRGRFEHHTVSCDMPPKQVKNHYAWFFCFPCP